MTHLNESPQGARDPKAEAVEARRLAQETLRNAETAGLHAALAIQKAEHDAYKADVALASVMRRDEEAAELAGQLGCPLGEYYWPFLLDKLKDMLAVEDAWRPHVTEKDATLADWQNALTTAWALGWDHSKSGEPIIRFLTNWVQGVLAKQREVEDIDVEDAECQWAMGVPFRKGDRE